MDVTAMPCTCGELFQGSLEGEACLVSCPIDVYSLAEVVPPGRAASCEVNRKTRQALERIAGQTGQEIAVGVKCPLPAGRGYGTSTADIGAALFAAGRALALDLTPEEAARIAVAVEPSDSTFFPGLALFDHRSGRFYRALGEPPPARLIILDGGGAVDSEAFNARDWREPLARLAGEHRCAYDLLQKGIAEDDLEAVGEAATRSAVCHQTILFNPLVDLALELSQVSGAAGICRAHSGTIVGLIYPADGDREAVMKTLSGRVPRKVNLREAVLTGGGARYLSLDKSRGERLRSGN